MRAGALLRHERARCAAELRAEVPREVVALNVRCLDDVDPTQFEIVHYDGKHLA